MAQAWWNCAQLVISQLPKQSVLQSLQSSWALASPLSSLHQCCGAVTAKSGATPAAWQGLPAGCRQLSNYPQWRRGAQSINPSPGTHNQPQSLADFLRQPKVRLMGIGLLAVSFLAYRLLSGPDISGPQVYMEFESGGEPLGRVVIGLYESVAPGGAANFRGLASGDEGYGYAGTPVHRIIRHYTIMAGDITKGDGSGGLAYKAPSFSPSTSFGSSALAPTASMHHSRGTVSMIVDDQQQVRSQFFIACMGMSSEVDKEMLPIGRVVSGMDVVDRISALPADMHHRPLQPITISQCGVLKSATAT